MVEDLALNVWAHLLESAHLSILLRYEFLAHGGDFDVYVLVGQVEVWSKEGHCLPVIVAIEDKRGWFVLPVDGIEIEESRELSFGVVGELRFV